MGHIDSERKSLQSLS